ncbi:MAG: hypothetical protein KIT73_09445 [Burkholderiales bacterium]|nr:hypothetical protein [Burkholderiales bacterium]
MKTTLLAIALLGSTLSVPSMAAHGDEIPVERDRRGTPAHSESQRREPPTATNEDRPASPRREDPRDALDRLPSDRSGEYKRS